MNRVYDVERSYSDAHVLREQMLHEVDSADMVPALKALDRYWGMFHPVRTCLFLPRIVIFSGIALFSKERVRSDIVTRAL